MSPELSVALILSLSVLVGYQRAVGGELAGAEACQALSPFHVADKNKYPCAASAARTAGHAPPACPLHVLRGCFEVIGKVSSVWEQVVQ